MDTASTMSFGDHLEELRKRVILALVVPLPFFILCLIFGGTLLDIVLAPLHDALIDAGLSPEVQALSPIEPFTAYLKVAAIVALLFAAPWVLYQFWLFIAPGLYAHERRFVYFFLPLSGLLTLAGALFLYYVMLPISLYFLIEFGTHIVRLDPGSAPLPEGVTPPVLPILPGDPPPQPLGSIWLNDLVNQLRIQVAPDRVMGVPLRANGLIQQQYRVGEYIGLVFVLGVAFILAFQLPVVMLLLGWLGIVDPAWLGKYRRWVLFGCAVVGAVLTPQDPLSMIVMGGALYGLFELGLILMRTIRPSMIAKGLTSDADQAPPEDDA